MCIVPQLVLSQLRAIHSLVKRSSETSLLLLLPDLLAGLKFYMATGLPGQPTTVTVLPSATCEFHFSDLDLYIFGQSPAGQD